MLTLRLTDHPGSIDLVDETGQVGYLVFLERGDGPLHGWAVHLPGTGRPSSSVANANVQGAVAEARDLYDILVERRATRAEWMRKAMRARPMPSLSRWAEHRAGVVRAVE